MSQIEIVSFIAADIEIRAGGDGRTVTGIVVPWDEPYQTRSYTETFKRGAFTKSVREVGTRTKFFRRHPQPGDGKEPIGRATLMREDASGLYGEFRVSRTLEGDEALELISDGVLDSFSVGFRPIRDRKDGHTVERVEAALDHVAVLHDPAYAGARVLALREADNDTEPEGTPALDRARRRLQML